MIALPELEILKNVFILVCSLSDTYMSSMSSATWESINKVLHDSTQFFHNMKLQTWRYWLHFIIRELLLSSPRWGILKNGELFILKLYNKTKITSKLISQIAA